MSKQGFTLAEVLVTLGIVGVVAAITIPNLVQNHRKSVIETRLKKFYTSINQAILMAENDYGERIYWNKKGMEFFNTYLKDYLNYISVSNIPVSTRTGQLITFEDGSAVVMDIYGSAPSSGHFIFCPEAKNCNSEYISLAFEYGNIFMGRKFFLFGYWPDEEYHKNKGVEPYIMNWNGDESQLYNRHTFGCYRKEDSNHAYCTAVIQHNGWKIPKDYPFRF